MNELERIHSLLNSKPFDALSSAELNEIESVLTGAEQHASAANTASDSLPILEQIGSLLETSGTTELTARTAFVMSLNARAVAQWDTARHAAVQASQMFAELGHPIMYGRCLLLLGALSADTGDNATAIRYYVAARSTFDSEGSQTYLASTFYNESLIFLQTGQLHRALHSISAALNLYRDLEDETNQAICTTWLGSTYRQFGQSAEALAAFQTAYECLSKLGQSRRAAACLLNAGNVQLDARRLREASALFQKAKLAYEKIGDVNRSAGCTLNLGFVKFKQLDFESALASFRDAKTVFLKQKDFRHQCEALLWEAEALLRMQRYDDALAASKLAHEISTQTTELPASAWAHLLAGRAFQKLNMHPQALQEHRNAISQLQRLANETDEMENAARMHRWASKAANWCAESANETGDIAAAFDFIQSVKALTHSRRTSPQIEESQAKEIMQLRVSLAKAQFECETNPDTAQRFSLSKKRDSLLLLLREAESRGRELGMQNVSSSDGVSITKLRDRLPKGGALIEFASSEESIVAILIQKDHMTTFNIVPISEEELQGRVTELITLLASQLSDPTVCQQSATQLLNLLFGAFEEQLKEIQSLIICPHSAMHSIPFQFVFESKSFFVSVSPSATSWVETQSTPVSFEDALLVGVSSHYESEQLSDLPNATKEIEFVREFVSGTATILINENATPSAVLASLSLTNVCHFATHAIANHTIPTMSHFVLSGPDPVSRRLYLKDIIDRQINADLVLLSACSSALGENTVSEGPLSLAWGFLRSGARNIVATHYPVHDEAALIWVRHFYKALSDGSTKAHAVKSASKELAENPVFSHPHYRGCWVLFGAGD